MRGPSVRPGVVVVAVVVGALGCAGPASAIPLGAGRSAAHSSTHGARSHRDAGVAAGVDRVVFTSNRDGGPDIYAADASPGAAADRLTSAAGFDESPSVSPDGSRIAFMMSLTVDSEIFDMEADDGEHTDLTNDPEYLYLSAS